MNNRGFPKLVGWLIRLLLATAVIAVFFVKPFSGGEQTTTDPAVVQSYDANMDIDRAGTMELTETLNVLLPEGKHGIYRVFDTASRQGSKKHPVTVESVSRDGEPEMYTDVGTTSGTQTIRIGNSNVILPGGVHTYTIKSRTTDVFTAGEGNTTLWWWNVIGSGWQMRFDKAHVTANLPATPTKAECIRGKDTSCTVNVIEHTMTMDAENLAPFEPVTVRLSFPSAALPAPPGAPSPLLVIVASVIAGLLSGGLALLLVSRTWEKPVGQPVLFEPPQGIYPALGAKVLNEVDSPYALQATLFDLAERGLLSLRGDESGWAITVVGEPSQTVMTAAEAGLLGSLGLNYHNATFNLAKNKTAGEVVSTAQRNLNSQVSVDSHPYLSYSASGCLGTVLGWLTLAATAFQLFTYFGGNQRPFWPLLIATAVFAFVAAGILIDRAAWTIRNDAGREMWSRVGGFGRFLTTDSSEARFNFAERLDLYPRYLPWALVLGSADKWAQRYRDQGVEPPTVPWLLWYGSSSNYSMTSMSDSFNSTISGAASAYAASQAASSGGGGFSGGSGGGGGGGGSW